MTYQRSASRLVDGSRTPGIYRVIATDTMIIPALAEAGWVTGSLGRTGSTDDFYTEVARALGFPNYFGRNLDALWDCLGDLLAPTAMIMTDWARLATADPYRWQKILTVLEERTEADNAVPFAVILGG